jgi:hypothetical protein
VGTITLQSDGICRNSNFRAAMPSDIELQDVGQGLWEIDLIRRFADTSPGASVSASRVAHVSSLLDHDANSPSAPMARGIEGNEVSTPKPAAKKTVTSSKSEKGQRSIVSFFQKASTSIPVAPSNSAGQSTKRTASPITPAPSSDAISPPSPEHGLVDRSKNKENGLPSPATPTEDAKDADRIPEGVDGKLDSSPSRKVRCLCCRPCLQTLLISTQAKKIASYAESDSEDVEVLKPLLTNGQSKRPSKRRKFSLEDSDDEFEVDAAMEDAMVEAGSSFALLTAVRLSSDASLTDYTQRILMTSSLPMIQKRMHHGLRNGKGHHPQMSPNNHHALHPNQISVTTTEVW